jgi:predicted MPP superfamily phosphohydrolase
MRAVAWVVFAHGPVDLLAAAALSARVAPRSAAALAVAALGTVGVAIEAFVVEPAAWDTTYYELESAKVTEPLRIVVLADIQVERVGDREWDVLEAAMDEEPDLVLLAGDYLQIPDAQEDLYLLETTHWKDLVDSTLEAPLGVYAVRGNAEVRGTWSPDLFAKTSITTFRQTASVDLGPVVLTGLSFWDSFATGYSVDDTADFHVILGHGPDFSLSDKARGDLLVAGHTHGGQVQVPFLGPLVTFSEVPNAHAAGGMFELSGGRHLVVSRGIGLERGYAPPLRLFCRPELVVIDVVPPGWGWPEE